jgi:hypothetical protein
MATEAWSGVSLTGGTSTGNLKQLYPTWCAAGAVKSTSVLGDQLRRPLQGALHSIQLKSDGAAAGTLEIWDIDGSDGGADVSSLTTITNAQLVALQTRGLAKLIYSQDYAAGVGSGPMNAAGIFRSFERGLAARLVSSGTAELNLVVEGGFFYTTSLGGY